MDKKIGKVTEVFIPNEYKNGQKIDIMDSKKIGFKILVDDEIIEMIENQDEINCDIFKDDLVLITKRVISGKTFIDIERYAGDIYE